MSIDVQGILGLMARMASLEQQRKQNNANALGRGIMVAGQGVGDFRQQAIRNEEAMKRQTARIDADKTAADVSAARDADVRAEEFRRRQHLYNQAQMDRSVERVRDRKVGVADRETRQADALAQIEARRKADVSTARSEHLLGAPDRDRAHFLGVRKQESLEQNRDAAQEDRRQRTEISRARVKQAWDKHLDVMQNYRAALRGDDNRLMAGLSDDIGARLSSIDSNIGRLESSRANAMFPEGIDTELDGLRRRRADLIPLYQTARARAAGAAPAAESAAASTGPLVATERWDKNMGENVLSLPGIDRPIRTKLLLADVTRVIDAARITMAKEDQTPEQAVQFIMANRNRLFGRGDDSLGDMLNPGLLLKLIKGE